MSSPTVSQPAAEPTIAPGGSTCEPDGRAIPDAIAIPAGFELLDEVGRGGMGLVYRARDVALDREVAVKILQEKFAPDSGTARRFVEEARITGQLQHPGIPAVYQVGTLADGRPFLAMKLIKGDTLDARLMAGMPIDPLAVFEAIGQAVGFAHAHGVIHRDLKPSNVMVGAFGEVQVMDWGLAKVLANRVGRDASSADPEATTDPTEIRSLRESDGSFTQAGSVLGTPAYMPPEQAAGELDKIDTRSDVFGLGAILCVLLSGKPPFDGKDPESVRINAVRGRTEDAFARLDACGADPDVIALCKRCLAFEPADRPMTADEVAQQVGALRRAADDRARQAERDKLSAEVRAAEQSKRRRILQWAAVAVVCVLTSGVIVSLWQAKRAKWAEAEALLKQRDAEDAQKAESEERLRAIKAAAAEKQAKEKALAKEREANAVVAFFEDWVFAAARPKGLGGGLGKGVTLREAIVASRSALATGFKDQPLVEARLRRTLGNTFHYLADYKAAAEQYERVEAIFTERLGPEHPDTLQCLQNRANVYDVLGRKPEALKLREETLAIQRRVLRQDDPDTLSTMSNLAVSYYDLGRHADALKLRIETLAIQERVLGPNHLDTIGSKINLAVSYDAVGRHADALKLREETLDQCKRVLPADHSYTLLSMNNLAISYEVFDRHDEAVVLREATVAAQKRMLPADHPETLGSMQNLANSYELLNRHKESLKLQEETLAARRRALPPDHPDTLTSMFNLAIRYARLGRHADALKLREETLAIRKRVLPPDHPHTLLSLAAVADSLCKLDRGAEAIPYIDECVAQAAGKTNEWRVVTSALRLRLRYFEKVKDPANCRATAKMWEQLNLVDSDSLYSAACYRAIAAGLYTKTGQQAESAADAERAMALLSKSIAAGYRDRVNMDADSDLDVLRSRVDFQKFLVSLPYVAPAPRPKPEK